MVAFALLSVKRFSCRIKVNWKVMKLVVVVVVVVVVEIRIKEESIIECAVN